MRDPRRDHLGRHDHLEAVAEELRWLGQFSLLIVVVLVACAVLTAAVAG